MIVSNKHKFVFVHIPKTGGTSMTMMLEPHLDEKAKKPMGRGWQSQFHKHGLHSGINSKRYRQYEDFFKFAIVRNPYDRLCSIWRSGMSGSAKYRFDKFVKICKPGNYKVQYNHIYENKKLLVDYIMKYENYDQEVRGFFDKFGLLCGEIPHKLKTTHRQKRKTELNQELSDIIYRKYRIDFDTFGYDKESWVNYKWEDIKQGEK